MAGSGKESAAGSSKTRPSEKVAEEMAPLLDTGDEGCCGCFGGLARALRRRFAPRHGGEKQGWLRRTGKLLSRKKYSHAVSPTNTPGRVHVDDGVLSPGASPSTDGRDSGSNEEDTPRHPDGQGVPGIVKANTRSPADCTAIPGIDCTAIPGIDCTAIPGIVTRAAAVPLPPDADVPPTPDAQKQPPPLFPVTVQILGHPVQLAQLLGRGAYGGVFRVTAAAGGSLAVKLTRVPAHHEFEAILKRAENATGHAHSGLVQTHAVSPGDLRDRATTTVAVLLFGIPNLLGCRVFWTLMEHGGPDLTVFYAQRVPGRRSADAAEGTRWCSALFDAVDYLHEKGLCHRDIKAENVLVKADDCGSRKLVIIDLEDVAPATEKHQRGTLFYQDRHAEAAPMPSDVWATAMVCHFVLTEGHLPAGIAQALQDPTAELYPPQGVPAVLSRLCPCWARSIAVRPTAATAKLIFTQDFSENLEKDPRYLAADLVPPDEEFIEFKQQYEKFLQS